MSNNRHSKSSLITASFLLILSYIIKIFDTPIILQLYDQQQFALLNFLTGVTVHQPLGFYEGRCIETIFGPLTFVLSGIALLIMALKYFQDAKSLKFGLFIFLYLLLTRPEVLLFPPYGDTASGAFVEAIWLFQHSFDYASLAQQPIFIQGGPKVYLFSLYPTYIALLMKIIAHAKTFLVINHLLVFYFSSVVIVYFRKILLEIFDQKKAMLISIFFISFPLFQTQVEAINMEMTILLFAMMAMFYLLKKNVFLASLLTIVGVCIKGYASIFCATVFFISLFLFFISDDRWKKWKDLGWGAFAMVCGVGITYASLFILNSSAHVDKVGMFEGWPRMKEFVVTYLYIISLFLFLGYYFKDKKEGHADSMIEYLKDHYQVLIFFVCSLGWFFLFLHSFGDQIRYKLILIPFCIICITYVASQYLRSDRWLNGALKGLIVFFFFCSYGFLQYPSEVNDDAKLERSLEYRADLELDLRLVRRLEEHYADNLISAPFTTAQILGMPELTYTTKKLDVMIYEFPIKYGTIKMFKGLKDIDIKKTIWVWIKVKLAPHLKELKEYPIGPHDVVMEEIDYGRRKATLFRGGVSIEKLRRFARKVRREMAIEDAKKKAVLEP